MSCSQVQMPQVKMLYILRFSHTYCFQVTKRLIVIVLSNGKPERTIRREWPRRFLKVRALGLKLVLKTLHQIPSRFNFNAIIYSI